MMRHTVTNSLPIELEEVDSGLQQSLNGAFSDSSNDSLFESQSELPRSETESLQNDALEESTSGSLDSSTSNTTFSVVPSKNLRFAKPIRITKASSTNNSPTTSTPMLSRYSEPFTSPKLIHSVRPVREISKVRINRAYELRFTENQEKEYLRNARRIAYSVYMTTAKVLKRVPKVELAAGFP